MAYQFSLINDKSTNLYKKLRIFIINEMYILCTQTHSISVNTLFIWQNGTISPYLTIPTSEKLLKWLPHT